MLLAVLVETYSDIIVDFWKRSRLVLFSLCALLEVYGTTTFVHSNVVSKTEQRQLGKGIILLVVVVVAEVFLAIRLSQPRPVPNVFHRKPSSHRRTSTIAVTVDHSSHNIHFMVLLP